MLGKKVVISRSWELVTGNLLSQTSKLGLDIVPGNRISRGWVEAHISWHDILILTCYPNVWIFGKNFHRLLYTHSLSWIHPEKIHLLLTFKTSWLQFIFMLICECMGRVVQEWPKTVGLSPIWGIVHVFQWAVLLETWYLNTANSLPDVKYHWKAIRKISGKEGN